MSTSGRAAGAALAYAGLIGLCALVGPRSGSTQDNRGGPDAREVQVVNPSTRPVPTAVQGIVPVRTAPGSQVCIDPDCNKVGIDPRCNTVTLLSSPENPVAVREVDDPAK